VSLVQADSIISNIEECEMRIEWYPKTLSQMDLCLANASLVELRIALRITAHGLDGVITVEEVLRRRKEFGMKGGDA